MLELLFSLHFIAIVVVIVALSIGFAYLCALIQRQLLSVSLGEWLLQHIYCPLTRVVLLIFIAFLVFPLIVQDTGYGELAELFMDTEFLRSLVNILFVSSLLFSFLPLLNQLALAIPVLGCIAIALIFLHQLALPADLDMHWYTSWPESLRILLLLLVSYYLSRWSTRHVSAWLNYQFNITSTRPLVLEIHYLILQTPILLAYGHSLYQQTNS